MSSASEDRFRQSWKAEELSGRPAQAWLVVRRIVATLLAIGLLVFCGWLILRMFRVPTSYLGYWSASAYAPLKAGPVKFACDDYAAIDAIKDSFAGTNLVNPAEKPLTKESLQKNLGELSSLGMRGKDSCIVFLTAHGVVRDKKPYFLCEPGGRDSEMPVSQVLNLLKEVPAGTKLLVVDAGRNELATEGSADDDVFTVLLDEEVKKNKDPSLWVLTANTALERSHVSPELSRSVFGLMVSEGLGGKADSDGDGEIRLNELCEYVQNGVSARVNVTTGGGDTQTPQVLHYDADAQSPSKVAAHRLIDTPKSPPEPVHVEHVAEPEEEGKKGRIRTIISNLTEQVKSQASIEGELHVASEILGIHSHDEHGEHAEHGDDVAAHDAHATEPAGGPAGAEHKSAAHDAKSETKVELAEAATKQVPVVWQKMAQLESSPDRTSPSIVFPPLWRELRERLLWCDQFCASGVPAAAKESWNQVAKELDGINESLKQLGAYRPPTDLDPTRAKALTDQGITFAFADRMAVNVPGMRLSKPLTDFVIKYNGLLTSEPPATFKEKLNAALLAVQKSDLGLEKYYEFQLLDLGKEHQSATLNKDPDVSSATLQLALRARRVGESVAADPLCGEGWCRKSVEAADRLRSEGERELFDRTSSDWESQATSRLTAALAGYDSAFRDLKTIGSAILARNAAIFRAADFIHLACLDGGSDDDWAAANRVFRSLRGLNEMLSNPLDDLQQKLTNAQQKTLNELLASAGNDSQTKLDDSKTSSQVLQELADELKSANNELQQRADAEDNVWRMSNLLATTIPSPESRKKLSDNLAATEHTQIAASKSPKAESKAPTASTIDTEQWKQLVQEFDLQVTLAELSGYTEAKELRELLAEKESESERIAKLDDAHKKLAAKMVDVPADLNSKLKEVAKASRGPISQLRQVLPQWLLLGRQQLGFLDKNNLVAILDRASWHDFLVWNSKRFGQAAVDSPLAVDPSLRRVSATFRDLANEMPNEVAVSSSDSPTLSIESAGDVSLLTSDSGEVTLKVISTTGKEQKVWLTAQYNNEWLEVDPSVYHQHDLPEDAKKKPDDEASQYPLRADKLGREETVKIPANESHDFRVKVNRLTASKAGGVTKLIVKAASGDTFVRRELNVNLPGKKLLDIAVSAPPGVWDPDTHSIRPLPNREQSISFDVVNLAEVARKLEVEIFAPTKVPHESGFRGLPTSAQKLAAANERLEAYGPLVPIGPKMPVELKDSDKTVRIKAADTMPPADPKANLLPVKADPDSPGLPIPHGLIVLMTDRETKEVTIRPIEIKPQRPTGYLKAEATYLREKERLEITVSAKNVDAIPPEGLQISADVTNVSDQRPRLLKGILKAPDYSTNLYAHLASSGPDEVSVGINVDDYPRAFVFRFLRSTAPRLLKPADGLMEVRITSPLPEAAFKAPLKPKSLEIVAEVDAPTNSFGDGDSKSKVEFGVDEQLNRHLRDDQLETRWADRQVSVAAKSLSPGGSLVLNTHVSDFHIGLSSGLVDGKVNLVGQVTVDGKTELSKPVEIRLDGSPPKIFAVLPVKREVEIGDDLIVRIVTHENEIDLSGVQKVEAAFETAADKTSKDSKGAKWQEGLPDKDNENSWLVTLSTNGIGLGTQTVLFRATDKVGNESTPFGEQVTVIRKQPKAAPTTPKEPPKPNLDNVVTGKVQYGNEAVKAKVSLESFIGPPIPAVDSDAKGVFKFPKVPPGKYTLKVATSEAIHNQKRTANMEVTVEPKPKPETSVTVKLK